MTERHYESFSFGLFVLFAGVLSLLVTLGFLSWALVLQFVIAYWPLFIIIAGIRIIGNAQLETGYFGLILDLLFYGLILVGLVYAGDKLFLAFDQKPSEMSTDAVNRSQFPKAVSKEYSLNFGAADVIVRDESTNRFLLASGPSGFSLTRDERMSEVAGITLKNEPTTRLLRFANFKKPEKFLVELGVLDLPATLNVNLGASNGVVELDQSMLTNVLTNVGAGNLETTLVGNSIPPEITIRVGAGKTVLRLVGEDSVRLEFSVGAGSLKLISEKRDLNKEFGGVGTKGVYEVVPNPRVVVNVSVGAGAVEVRLE